MPTVGLLFGSFNPVHTGHLMIAEYFATQGGCDWVELVVSPQNPLKTSSGLAPEEHRLAMARLAARGNPLVKVNAIEFQMPKPSYTYRTLQHLSKKYPDHNFKVIIGSDNFDQFHKWKNQEDILSEYDILSYRRPGYTGSVFEKHKHVQVLDNVPQIHISGTYIRACVRKGHSVRYLVADLVRTYIVRHALYL